MSNEKRIDAAAVDIALPLLREFEGLRLTAYRDVAGHWTIGYGHRCDGPGQIGREEAERLLIDDALAADAAVTDAVRVPLNVHQRAALICLTFNIGAEALKDSTLVRLLNDGEALAASQEFVRWVHAGGAVLSGLVRRRAAERELFLSPVPAAAAGVADDEAPDWLDSLKAGALGWLGRRALEPSTWRGVGGVLVAAGLLSAGSVEVLIAAGLSIASAVEVVRKEEAAR